MKISGQPHKIVIKQDVGVFDFLKLGLLESMLKEILLTKKDLTKTSSKPNQTSGTDAMGRCPSEHRGQLRNCGRESKLQGEREN